MSTKEFTLQYGKPERLHPDYENHICCSPELEKDVLNDFSFLEIEIMQGVREERKDGMIYFFFNVTDPQKLQAFVDYKDQVIKKYFLKQSL